MDFFFFREESICLRRFYQMNPKHFALKSVIKFEIIQRPQRRLCKRLFPSFSNNRFSVFFYFSSPRFPTESFFGEGFLYFLTQFLKRAYSLKIIYYFHIQFHSNAISRTKYWLEEGDRRGGSRANLARLDAPSDDIRIGRFHQE